MRRLGIALSLFVLIVTACHKRTPVTALPPPAPIPAAAAPITPLPIPQPPPTLPAPPLTPVVSPIEQADFAFNLGNFSAAARSYESYLQSEPHGDRRDQAMFRLAISYASISTPDWPRAINVLKQLIEQFPYSPLKTPASVIVSLQTDLTTLSADTQKRDQRIKQLTNELDKLKQIDAARRKRP